ncbi:hypothetical protein evm_003524 [Chilo suppressalis]|nr:hypothetical protein evm_003524 [Chilo suppressalis]
MVRLMVRGQHCVCLRYTKILPALLISCYSVIIGACNSAEISEAHKKQDEYSNVTHAVAVNLNKRSTSDDPARFAQTEESTAVLLKSTELQQLLLLDGRKEKCDRHPCRYEYTLENRQRILHADKRRNEDESPTLTSKRRERTTDNGVYKYKEDGSLELYTALGEDVMYIAVTSDGTVMYIATWPQNRVHKITNEGQKLEAFSAVPNGHGLTVDTRNNIYFVATKTSYILKNGNSVPIKIKGLPSDKMIGVFVSRSDEVFGMDENSNLYVIDSENANARHLGSFNVTGVNSFAMDSADNVLIGVKSAIVKFNAFEKNPCSDYEKPAVTTSKKGKKRHSKKRKQRKRTTTTTEPSEEEDSEE